MIPHPYGISLFEHSVYFTDWTKMAVMKANRFADSNPQVIFQSSLRPYGVTIYHAFRQPQGKSDDTGLPKEILHCSYCGLTVRKHSKDNCAVNAPVRPEEKMSDVFLLFSSLLCSPPSLPLSLIHAQQISLTNGLSGSLPRVFEISPKSEISLKLQVAHPCPV